MKILGITVSPYFEEFYNLLSAQIGMPIIFTTNPHKASGDFRIENGEVRIRLRTDLPKSSFEHNAAHELVHALEDVQFWPSTQRSSSLTDNSAEAEVGATLGSLVRDLHVEQLLGNFDFDSTLEINSIYENAKKQIPKIKELKRDSSQWVWWVLRYAWLYFIQPKKHWLKLKTLFVKYIPGIVAKGEEIIKIVMEHGFDDPGKALICMIAIRNSLNLQIDERCTILDPVSGLLY